MKKKQLLLKQMKPIQILFFALCCCSIFLSCETNERDFYQIKIYTLETDQQEKRIDHYLQNAFSDNKYYFHKKMMIELLDFISKAEYVSNLENWHNSAHFAKLLKEAFKNEGV